MAPTSEFPWIIAVDQAAELIERPDVPIRVADVRWYLNGHPGLDEYRSGHVPGAAFVDLDTVLAAPGTAETGRHPLPDAETFAAGMESAGIDDESVVIAYDDASGASASRLVWLLRATGHTAMVLDGGIQAWVEAFGQESLVEGSGDVAPADPGSFARTPVNPEWTASMEDAETAGTNGRPLIDSRAPERYRGETEPMDAWAGHIPGAQNVFHAKNIGDDGRFLSAPELRKRFEDAGVPQSTDDAGTASPIVYCGSGVTACHNLVAMEAAGLHGRLYAGSWSQYSALHPAPAADSPATQSTAAESAAGESGRDNV